MGRPDIRLLTEEYGFRVFPIRSRSKKPAIKAWPERATSDIEEARSLWRDCNLFVEEFNAGVCTDGLCIIDIDKMPSGWSDIILPKTFRVATGRGEHWYFTTSVPVKSGPLYPGEVDIKSGRGAMVLAPGSTHPSGAVYTIIDPTPPAPLEQFRFLTTILQDNGKFRRAGGQAEFVGLPDPEPDEDNPLFVQASWSQVNTLGERGDRNRSLFLLACGLYRDYAASLLTRQTVEDILREGCRMIIADDFTSEEAIRTVNSAFRSVFGKVD